MTHDLPHLPSLVPQIQPAARHGALHAGPDMDLLATPAHLHEAPAGAAGGREPAPSANESQP